MFMQIEIVDMNSMMIEITFTMHCLQLFAGMTHLWNIPDSAVPAAIESMVEAESSLHLLHLQMKKNCAFYREQLVVIKFC